MSLLGSQVYASPSKPLWLSAGGSITTSGVTSTGDILAEGASPAFPQIAVTDLSGNVQLGLSADANYSLIESADDILFRQPGETSGNTILSLSAPGSASDRLQVLGTVSAKFLDLNDFPPDASVGSATLTSGTVTVSTTASDVTSYIFLTRGDLNTSTAVGELRVSNKGANNFTVVSVDSTGTTETGDASSFDWMIVNAAL